MQCKKNTSGFTLIEVMIVIVIMGVLAGIAVPNIMGVIERSRENIDLTKLFYLREALNRALVENEDALYNSAYVTGSDSASKANLAKLKKALTNENGVQLFIIEMRPDLPTNIQGKHRTITKNSEMSDVLGKSGTWYDALRESGFNGVADIVAARSNGNEWKSDGATFYSQQYTDASGNTDYRTYPKEPIFISKELNNGKSCGLSGITTQGSKDSDKTNYRLTMSFHWSMGDSTSRSIEVALLPNGAKMREKGSGKGGALLTDHGVCFSTYGPIGCADYTY